MDVKYDKLKKTDDDLVQFFIEAHEKEYGTLENVSLGSSPTKSGYTVYGSIVPALPRAQSNYSSRTHKLTESLDDVDLSSVTSDTARATTYRNEIICTVVCCLGNLSHGLAFGLASPAVPKLLASGSLTQEQAGWFSSLLTLGALFGGFIVGVLMNCIGRKHTVLLAGLPFIGGWMCIAASHWYPILYAGRILTGIGYGLLMVACPVYIAECVSREIRGTMGMSVVLGHTFGTMLQYSIGLALDTRDAAVVSILPVVLMLMGMIRMPETPRWLIQQGQLKEALRALCWLRMDEARAREELEQMTSSKQAASSPLRDTCAEIPKSIKPLVICTMMFIFQQFSGITAIMFNAEWMLSAMSWGGDTPPGVLAVILATVKMMATISGMMVIDKLGRKPLFISCGIIMAASMLVMGLYFFLQDVYFPAWIPVMSIFLYVSAYSIAWAGIPLLILAELPPMKVRGMASALASIATWLTAFVLTQQFMAWTEAIHMYGVLWIFGGVCVIGCIFVYVCLPETKLRSLEDLEEELALSIHT